MKVKVKRGVMVKKVRKGEVRKKYGYKNSNVSFS
jgi:hypothetical protein